MSSFFREMLGDIDEPTLPFGITDVHRDGGKVLEARRMLPQSLNDRLRDQARRLGVSLASLCHLAWGQVLARAERPRRRWCSAPSCSAACSAGAGADRAMGLFINTLPLRLDLDGTGVEDAVRRTHARLAEPAAPRTRFARDGPALQRRLRASPAVQRPAQLPPQHAAAGGCRRSCRYTAAAASSIAWLARRSAPTIP